MVRRIAHPLALAGEYFHLLRFLLPAAKILFFSGFSLKKLALLTQISRIKKTQNAIGGIGLHAISFFEVL